MAEMESALAMTYLWIKAAHIIFVIFPMAGLFLLPRFFLYHQEAPPGSPEAALAVNPQIDRAGAFQPPVRTA